MEIINCQHIYFAYNSTNVLKDISESIDQGEFLGLLGPNGCGKTTLLKCMNGLLNPQKGEINLDQKPISAYRHLELARKIGYVPQLLSNVFPATVFDTVLMGRKPYIQWKPSKPDLDIVAEIILKLDLEDIALKDINKLSGGQRQRVFIGRALAQKPQLILLDEPTANLDMHHQHEVMALLKNLSNKGITIIVAIHDLNLALQYCSRFFLMKSGEVKARGGFEIFIPELLKDVYQMEVDIYQKNRQLFILPKTTGQLSV